MNRPENTPCLSDVIRLKWEDLVFAHYLTLYRWFATFTGDLDQYWPMFDIPFPLPLLTVPDIFSLYSVLLSFTHCTYWCLFCPFYCLSVPGREISHNWACHQCTNCILYAQYYWHLLPYPELLVLHTESVSGVVGWSWPWTSQLLLCPNPTQPAILLLWITTDASRFIWVRFIYFPLVFTGMLVAGSQSTI